jgi:hypothetical protein
MRKLVLPLFAAATLTVAGAVGADMTTTTKTTTTYSGTLSELSPSTSTVTVRSSDADSKVYHFTERTSWVDESGATITMEQAKNHPVVVQYEPEGDQMRVTKVIVKKSSSPKVIEEKTTKTITE